MYHVRFICLSGQSHASACPLGVINFPPSPPMCTQSFPFPRWFKSHCLRFCCCKVLVTAPSFLVRYAYQRHFCYFASCVRFSFLSLRPFLSPLGSCSLFSAKSKHSWICPSPWRLLIISFVYVDIFSFSLRYFYIINHFWKFALLSHFKENFPTKTVNQLQRPLKQKQSDRYFPLISLASAKHLSSCAF